MQTLAYINFAYLLFLYRYRYIMLILFFNLIHVYVIWQYKTKLNWTKYELSLSHLLLVLHICVGEPGQHRLRYWLVACSAPSHYLNQCSFILNSTVRNKLQEKLNKIQSISLRKMYLKISSAKWRPYFVSDSMCQLPCYTEARLP